MAPPWREVELWSVGSQWRPSHCGRLPGIAVAEWWFACSVRYPVCVGVCIASAVLCQCDWIWGPLRQRPIFIREGPCRVGTGPAARGPCRVGTGPAARRQLSAFMHFSEHYQTTRTTVFVKNL